MKYLKNKWKFCRKWKITIGNCEQKFNKNETSDKVYWQLWKNEMKIKKNNFETKWKLKIKLWKKIKIKKMKYLKIKLIRLKNRNCEKWK